MGKLNFEERYAVHPEDFKKYYDTQKIRDEFLFYQPSFSWPFNGFSMRITKMRIEGITKMVKIVDTAMPPRITLPRPLYSSEPDPGNSTSGSMPKILVVALIYMGRSLLLVASRTASLYPMLL